MKIGIIGLGYVGLPLAVEFGKQHAVLGFDICSERVSELRSGKDSTFEVSSENLKLATHLSFSDNVADLNECGIFIVTVPTPVDKVNQPDLSPLIGATKIVGAALKYGAIVIFESTVYPGCTEEVCVPVLEEISGLRLNEDFYCGYSPERVNPGDKINTLTKIKKITSGSTPKIARVIDSLYSSIIPAGTFLASSIRVAEAAKVIENTQRDLNIALVNELSVIFSRLQIDTIEVLEAAGSKWNFLPFRPGLVGGHCIGVDPYYLTYKAEAVGYHPQLILAGRRINDNMARYVARNVIRLMLKNGVNVPKSRVGVLGITFKENCPDIRNSKVIDLIRELQEWGVEVVVSDPWANPMNVFLDYGINLQPINDLGVVDALVIAVGHNEFRSLNITNLQAYCKVRQSVIADVKAIYSKDELQAAGFTVFRL